MVVHMVTLTMAILLWITRAIDGRSRLDRIVTVLQTIFSYLTAGHIIDAGVRAQTP
jgi:hypothetical protein